MYVNLRQTTKLMANKTLLKKTLAEFNAEQLRELILEMYTARSDIKEYINFFLDPDSKALAEKCIKPIMKELDRNKWGDCTARFSKIRKEIKHFESFSPDPPVVIEFYRDIVFRSLIISRYNWFGKAQANGYAQLLKKYLEISERNERLDSSIEGLDNFIKKNGLRNDISMDTADIISEFLDEKKL